MPMWMWYCCKKIHHHHHHTRWTPFGVRIVRMYIVFLRDQRLDADPQIFKYFRMKISEKMCYFILKTEALSPMVLVLNDQ